MEKKILIRRYLRDSHNPYPGKLIETKIVKPPRAALRFTEAESRIESKTNREIKTAAEIAEWFEAFVDSALEGGYQ